MARRGRVSPRRGLADISDVAHRVAEAGSLQDLVSDRPLPFRTKRRSCLTLLTVPISAEWIATPVPRPEEWLIPFVTVREVRVREDGRVGAIVYWGEDVLFRIYRRDGEQWLIDEFIPISGGPIELITPPDTTSAV